MNNSNLSSKGEISKKNLTNEEKRAVNNLANAAAAYATNALISGTENLASITRQIKEIKDNIYQQPGNTQESNDQNGGAKKPKRKSPAKKPKSKKSPAKKPKSKKSPAKKPKRKSPAKK